MLLLKVGYLILPLIIAGVAHGLVIKANLFPALAVPLDAGKSYRGRPVFGRNKTWRGVVLTSTFCMLGVLAQQALYTLSAFRGISLLHYSSFSWLSFGLVVGIAYSASELPNSFVKRRLAIPPGVVSQRHTLVQYVADQADSVLGGTLVLAYFLPGAVGTLVLVFAVGFFVHLLMDQLSYVFGIKRLRPTLFRSA
jgi:CDP-archaeol synthase